MTSYKRQIVRITSAFVLSFVLLWILIGMLIHRGYIPVFFSDPVVMGLLMSVLIVSIFLCIFYRIRFTALFNDLRDTIRFIDEIKEGNYKSSGKIKAKVLLVDSINSSICDIAEGQKRQLYELNKRTAQLDEKNTELNEAYMQLESSFGQLQAALDQLNDSEKRYHSLIVNIPDVVLTLDNSGNITYASRSVKDVLKYRRRDIVGKPFRYILYYDKNIGFDFERLRQDIERTGGQSMNISLRRKDDSQIQTEIKFTPIIESLGDNRIQAIIRDVTEQRRMENILRENNRRLEILNRFNHRLASSGELTDIYKICVNTVTGDLGFYGCIYFMMGKNERFYHVMDYSGDYFIKEENLEQFTYVHRNVKALNDKESDGIILDFETVPQYFAMKYIGTNAETKYSQAYIQELRMGGEAAGLILVLSKNAFLLDEMDILRSIGHTTAVAVENTMYLIKSKDNYVQTIDALVAAIEAKDQYTRGHSQRVSAFAVKIADRMGLTRQQIEELRIAGILHDIGKIGISDRILLKKGPLSKEEYEEIKKHPAISNKILYPIGLSDRILKAVAFHHERFDGKGYPFGLTSESLGIEPQIIAIADAFDAMTTFRPYREALSWQKAVQELKDNSGSQFHPEIAEIMIKIQLEENSDDMVFSDE